MAMMGFFFFFGPKSHYWRAAAWERRGNRYALHTRRRGEAGPTLESRRSGGTVGAMGDGGVRGQTLSNSLGQHDGPSAHAPPALKWEEVPPPPPPSPERSQRAIALPSNPVVVSGVCCTKVIFEDDGGGIWSITGQRALRNQHVNSSELSLRNLIMSCCILILAEKTIWLIPD